jgi:hypothetical protein
MGKKLRLRLIVATLSLKTSLVLFGLCMVGRHIDN